MKEKGMELYNNNKFDQAIEQLGEVDKISTHKTSQCDIKD